MEKTANDVLYDEYAMITSDTAKLRDQLLLTNDLYIGLNTLAITAVGYALINLGPHALSTWWVTGACVAVTTVVLTVNVTWLRLATRYYRDLLTRSAYLESLEKALRDSGLFPDIDVFGLAKNPLHSRGIHSIEAASRFRPDRVVVTVERGFILIFSTAYILGTVGVGVTTYLVQSHVISPIPL